MRWILVTEERIGQSLVRSLPAVQEVACVVTSNAIVRRLCRKAGIRVESPEKEVIAGLPRLCGELGVEVLANVHGMRILPANELLAAGVFGINVHVSALPDLAGVYPYAWAIQLGRERHGVTLHQMVDKVDAGKILLQETWPLAGDETAYSLFERCEEVGTKMVLGLLDEEDEALKERFRSVEVQEAAGRTYRGFAAIKEQIRLSHNMSCAQASRLIRSRDFRPMRAVWPLPLLDGERVLGLAQTGGRTVMFRDGTLQLEMLSNGGDQSSRDDPQQRETISSRVSVTRSQS